MSILPAMIGVRLPGPFMFFVLCALLAPAARDAAVFADDDTRSVRISVLYYGDIACDHCDTVLDGTLPELESRYGVGFSVDAFDILQPAHERAARDRLADLGLNYRFPPVLFIGNNAYQGNYAIDRRVPEEVEYFLEKNRFRPFDYVASQTRYEAANPDSTGRDADDSSAAEGRSAAEDSAAAEGRADTKHRADTEHRAGVDGQNAAGRTVDNRNATDAREEAFEAPGPAVTSPGDPGVLRFFWGVGCPFCEDAKPTIDTLERRYPDLVVERYEVFQSDRHHDTFIETLQHYGSTSTGVPQTFFEEYAWIGYTDQIGRQIEEAVQGGMVDTTIDLPVFGRLSPEDVPLVTLTAAIAFVDGFNPCSLWVLTLLLGLIAHTRSRKRILLVGGTFLLVTAAVYGLFILGLVNVFLIAGNTMVLRILVGVIAVAMGLINIKDYFFFKRGFSLMIPARFQRPIAAGGRVIATAAATTAGLVGMTIVFATAIAIVELPCTAGFPLIWSRYVTGTGASGSGFYSLLGLYLLVYLALEMAIVLSALFTMARVRFSADQARPIKLVGGAIMVSLGVFYVIDPEIAGTLSGVGLIFLFALGGAACAVILRHVSEHVTRSG